ncbi:hypothetical protein D3C84_975780 [compost metagenome]
MHNAVVIGFENFASGFHQARVKHRGQQTRNARIVDQQRHVASLRHRGGNRCRVADVQTDSDHAWNIDTLGISYPGVDLARAPCHEFFCKGETETTVGAGNKCNGIFDFHCYVL